VSLEPVWRAPVGQDDIFKAVVKAPLDELLVWFQFLGEELGTRTVHGSGSALNGGVGLHWGDCVGGGGGGRDVGTGGGMLGAWRGGVCCWPAWRHGFRGAACGAGWFSGGTRSSLRGERVVGWVMVSDRSREVQTAHEGGHLWG
jgi:hypothetical protein